MTAENKTEHRSDTDDLDPNSLAAIRNLLANEEPAPVVAPKTSARPKAPVSAPKIVVRSSASESSTPAPEQPAEKVQDTPADSAPQDAVRRVIADDVHADDAEASLIDRLKAKVTGYRPKPKHIIVTGSLLLVYFRPWLVLGLFLLLAFIITGVFLILGYDGFWRRAMGIARWHARRNPSRSAELHRRLDNFAMKFDAFLDRFPEGSVDGLYLPDFGDLAEAEARHDEALDRRLSSLRESGA